MKIDLTKLDWVDVNLPWDFDDEEYETNQELNISKEDLQAVEIRQNELFGTRFTIFSDNSDKSFSNEEIQLAANEKIRDWAEQQPEIVNYRNRYFEIVNNNFLNKYLLKCNFYVFVQFDDGEVDFVTPHSSFSQQASRIIKRFAPIEFDRKLELSTPEIKMLQEIDREGFVELNAEMHVEDVAIAQKLFARSLVSGSERMGPAKEWIRVTRKVAE